MEQFAKTADGKWFLTEYESEDETVILESVEFQISLRDIYDRIKFEILE